MLWLLGILCNMAKLKSLQFVFMQGWIFLLSLLGMAPLAERLGFVTE